MLLWSERAATPSILTTQTQASCLDCPNIILMFLTLLPLLSPGLDPVPAMPRVDLLILMSPWTKQMILILHLSFLALGLMRLQTERPVLSRPNLIPVSAR